VNSPPPKPEVILTNFFAEPTVLLVPITSRGDISVDCNDFDAGYLITYRKIKFYTAKINDIWTKNEINNKNNHKVS
jgi:hypothetical protein